MQGAAVYLLRCAAIGRRRNKARNTSLRWLHWCNVYRCRQVDHPAVNPESSLDKERSEPLRWGEQLRCEDIAFLYHCLRLPSGKTEIPGVGLRRPEQGPFSFWNGPNLNCALIVLRGAVTPRECRHRRVRRNETRKPNGCGIEFAPSLGGIRICRTLGPLPLESVTNIRSI